MQFCTTCGKEVAPGKKFCEYCGAPVEQPAPVPPAPVAAPPMPAAGISPPATPSAAPGGSGKNLLIAGIIVVLVLIAGVYFIGLPMITGSSSPGTAHPQATNHPTQIQTPVPATQTSTPSGSPVPAETPVAGLTYDDRYMETYTQFTPLTAHSPGDKK